MTHIAIVGRQLERHLFTASADQQSPAGHVHPLGITRQSGGHCPALKEHFL
jgi:hypothetical protein